MKCSMCEEAQASVELDGELYCQDCAVEIKLHNEHYNALEKHFTKKELEGANIGWGAGDNSICSKIYKAKGGCKTFQTDFNGISYEHTIEEYRSS